jgi:hypothetical protein
MIFFTFVHTQFVRLKFGILIKVVLIFSITKFGLFANACGVDGQFGDGGMQFMISWPCQLHVQLCMQQLNQ